MGLCQDCGENDATHILYDKDKNTSFLVCHDCIGVNDIVMIHTIKDIVSYEVD